MTLPGTIDVDPAELKTFLQRLKGGGGEQLAAAAVGWSQLRLRQVLAMPEIQEAVRVCRQKDLESLERVSYQLASRGNTEMLKLWLYCQGGDRGWRPPTQRVETRQIGRPDAATVASVRVAIQQALKAGELRPAEVDDDVVDAEIVEDADA